mgnify:CR=1 FL=1
MNSIIIHVKLTQNIAVFLIIQDIIKAVIHTNNTIKYVPVIFFLTSNLVKPDLIKFRFIL